LTARSHANAWQLAESSGLADFIFMLGDTPVKRKTSKSAAKRFKVTGTGKIMRHHSHARHILTKKPRKRVRKLADAALVSKADSKRVKKMLNI
jgi:large subunit ribosomal protein L35